MKLLFAQAFDRVRKMYPSRAATTILPTAEELKRQADLADRVFAALSQAAAANHHPGGNLGRGALEVAYVTNDADRRTVLVEYIDGSGGIIPRDFVCQFGVGVRSAHVRLKGSEESCPLDSPDALFDRLLEKTRRHIRDWRLLVAKGD